jgi:hypothetical protein
VEESIAAGRLHPLLEGAQLRRGRDLAGAQHLVVVEQRRAGGVQRLQQRARVAQQRQAPVALGGGGLDQALLEPADLDRHLGIGVVVDRGDARGDHLGQQVGRGTHGKAQVVGAVVVAGDQAPQLTLAHQRHHQRGRHAHVAQVLQVQWRHAAQRAHRHVQFGGAAGHLARHQSGGGIVDVDQKPHAIADVQLAGALRDVGGRIVVTEQRLEPWIARLGDDLAVAVGVELVDHDAVVAGHLAEALHHRV